MMSTIEERYFFGRNDVSSSTRHLLSIGKWLGSNEFEEDTYFKVPTEKEHCWIDHLIVEITVRFEDLFEPRGFSKEPRSRLLVYWSLLPCIYECGAVLGRARRAKVELLELMIPLSHSRIQALHPKPVRRETSIVNSAKEAASLRLDEFTTKKDREPMSFTELVDSTIVATFFPADITVKEREKSSQLIFRRPFSLNEVYPYLRVFLLEGVGVGSTFPDLTERLFGNRYQSIDMAKWNKSKKETRQQGMVFPEEPTAINLIAFERDILITIAMVSEDSYPQLLQPLDLVPYSYSYIMDDCSRGSMLDRAQYMHRVTFEAWVEMYRHLLGEP